MSAKIKSKKISLVVPCFNEEGNVIEFYKCVKEYYQDSIENIEFIFIDDGSEDQTYQKLQQIYNNVKEKMVIVIRFSRNYGKEAAIYAGLQHATGKYVCIIDADLQQPPEVVKKMEKILDEETDVDCVTAYQEKRHEGKIISFIKKMFYNIINKVADVQFIDGASDFRMFRQNIRDAILMLSEKERFSKGIFSWIGFETKYIPYEVKERHSGGSKWSFKKLVKYGFNGIMAFSIAPLKCATFLGGSISFITLLYFIIVIIQKILFGIDVPGFPTLVCLILLLGGIQLIILGIIGEYLGKTYIEGKNRPIYIAKEILGEDENSK